MRRQNGLIFYEIDQETTKTVLRLPEYGNSDDTLWVLLEPVGGAAGPS